MGSSTVCPPTLHFMASWSPRRTRSPSTGAGFTAYYVRQNVTSSLSARPGSTLEAANCGPASWRARPRPSPAAAGRPTLPPLTPALAARFRRAGAGVVRGGRGWQGGGPRPPASPVSHGWRRVSGGRATPGRGRRKACGAAGAGWHGGERLSGARWSPRESGVGTMGTRSRLRDCV